MALPFDTGGGEPRRRPIHLRIVHIVTATPLINAGWGVYKRQIKQRRNQFMGANKMKKRIQKRSLVEY